MQDEINTGLDSATLHSVIAFLSMVRGCEGYVTQALGWVQASHLHAHDTNCCAPTAVAAAQMTRGLQLTTLISLLQPAPEVVALFDDIILMAEGAGPGPG